MKRFWIDYHDTKQYSQMTFWVHEAVGAEEVEARDRQYDPPMPAKRPFKGFPVFNVEVDGFTFKFASLHELRHCIDTFEKKVLPQTVYDSTTKVELDPAFDGWANQHWLSRLPGHVKSWKYRQKAVAYLRKAHADFETA